MGRHNFCKVPDKKRKVPNVVLYGGGSLSLSRARAHIALQEHVQGDTSGCSQGSVDIKTQVLFSVKSIPGGAGTCSEGFVKCFLRIPQAVGLHCSCHAAQASKGNFQKIC